VGRLLHRGQLGLDISIRSLPEGLPIRGVNAVSERPLLNNRALEDEGKLGKTLDSDQRYASGVNAGPGPRKSEIYFSNVKNTKNALKFDWAAFLRRPAILILEILCRDTDFLRTTAADGSPDFQG
jgi:hypothetical protein